MTEYLELFLKILQPSQLYISEKKLAAVQEKIDSNDIESIGILPVKKLDEDLIFTDGHTRAYAAYLEGFSTVLCEIETEELDWEMYEICVKWCKDEGITAIADLRTRVIPHAEYEVLWYQRCATMQKELLEKRASKK
ncbi:MAG: hypothetical protein ACTSSH_07455 [Candidatus Heimdallarchaeota archaeon]